jgi:hypothetical protein
MIRNVSLTSFRRFLIWIGSDQEKTFGPTITSLIYNNIPPERMILWDSKKRGGRPDTVKLLKEVWDSFGAEVIFITSNKQGNDEMMQGCRAGTCDATQEPWRDPFDQIANLVCCSWVACVWHAVGLLTEVLDRIDYPAEVVYRNLFPLGGFYVNLHTLHWGREHWLSSRVFSFSSDKVKSSMVKGCKRMIAAGLGQPVVLSQLRIGYCQNEACWVLFRPVQCCVSQQGNPSTRNKLIVWSHQLQPSIRSASPATGTCRRNLPPEALPPFKPSKVRPEPQPARSWTSGL